MALLQRCYADESWSHRMVGAKSSSIRQTRFVNHYSEFTVVALNLVREGPLVGGLENHRKCFSERYLDTVEVWVRVPRAYHRFQSLSRNH